LISAFTTKFAKTSKTTRATSRKAPRRWGVASDGNTYLMLKRRDRHDRGAPRVTPAIGRRRVEPCRKLKAVWPLAAFNSGVARSVPRAARRPVADRQTDSYPAIPEFKSISSWTSCSAASGSSWFQRGA